MRQVEGLYCGGGLGFRAWESGCRVEGLLDLELDSKNTYPHQVLSPSAGSL